VDSTPGLRATPDGDLRRARRMLLPHRGEPPPGEPRESAPRDLGPGIYWLRLTQSGRSVRRSVVLLP